MLPITRCFLRAMGVCAVILGTILASRTWADSQAPAAGQSTAAAFPEGLPKDKAEAGKVIFERVLQAIGGRENLQKIRDSKLSVLYKVSPENRELLSVYYMKLPDKLRIDIMNESWTRAFDGAAGWQYSPNQNFTDLSTAALVDLKNSALSVQGMLYPENLNIAPVFEGQATIKGKNYLLISYANRHGYDLVFVHIDPDTFLPLVSTSIKSNSRITVASSDYREIEGVKLPFFIGINLDGSKTIQMTVKEWKLNSNLEDALFDKKAVQAQVKEGRQIDLSGFNGADAMPELIHKTKPEYPELALRARVSGKVMLRLVINEEGLVGDATIIKGHPLLNSAAIACVRQWKYRPIIKNGKPVPAIITVPVEFH